LEILSPRRAAPLGAKLGVAWAAALFTAGLVVGGFSLVLTPYAGAALSFGSLLVGTVGVAQALGARRRDRSSRAASWALALNGALWPLALATALACGTLNALWTLSLHAVGAAATGAGAAAGAGLLAFLKGFWEQLTSGSLAW